MKAEKIRIRTKKSDSAFVYHTLEAHEGLTAYRTLPHMVGDPHREMELMFSPEARSDVKILISDLQKHLFVEVMDQE